MDYTRVRTPSSFSTAPFRSRPGGPRSPRSPSAAKNIIPLDLSARLDEATPAYSSPYSSASSPSSPRLPLESDIHSECSASTSSRRVSRAIQTGTPDSVPAVPATLTAAAPAVKVIKKTPTLVPPPAVNFDTPPVRWRGMTLEAAQWNLTSQQLQDIVSTAIRASASESFIRLVSRHTLDVELVQELERLDKLKVTTQAQYRFSMHRRLMLLQSLNALALAPAPADPSTSEALATLTQQLTALTAACDRLMETLLTVADQRAQIQRLQDVHVASALAISLRKLNASYGRRATEVRDGRAQIAALQAELEEAWGAAHELAQEMDDLDNFGHDFGYEDEDAIADEPGAVFEDASVVIADSCTERSVQMAEVLPVTGVAVASAATYATLNPGPLAPSPALLPVVDRTSRVTAARRRSTRASKASLRLQPTGSPSEEEMRESVAVAAHTVRQARSRSRSRSMRRPTVSKEGGPSVPAVPSIQVDVVPYKDSFLELSETRPATPSSAAQDVSPPPQVLTIPSKRNTLEVPMASPHRTPSTPGFDRTIIPPDTLGESPRTCRDDLFFPEGRARERGSGVRQRRAQSLQPDAVGLADKAAHRRSAGDVLERASGRATRYTLPLKAAFTQGPEPSGSTRFELGASSSSSPPSHVATQLEPDAGLVPPAQDEITDVPLSDTREEIRDYPTVDQGDQSQQSPPPLGGAVVDADALHPDSEARPAPGLPLQTASDPSPSPLEVPGPGPTCGS